MIMKKPLKDGLRKSHPFVGLKIRDTGWNNSMDDLAPLFFYILYVQEVATHFI